MAREVAMSDARRAAEATARYLLGVADETRLGEFEEELVDCIRALLAETAPAPPPAARPTPIDCSNCAALRGTSRLLAESALYLIDRNAELTRELEELRARERRMRGEG